MRAANLDIGQGLGWYGCGWRLFHPAAAVWILYSVGFLVAAVICFMIPLLGAALFMLLLPLFAAGFYIGADAVHRGSTLELDTLLRGFTHEEIRSPVLVFLISYAVLGVIASIPFLLGLVVLFPIAFCALYCAYRGVFK